jgi:hypothetical protein
MMRLVLFVMLFVFMSSQVVMVQPSIAQTMPGNNTQQSTNQTISGNDAGQVAPFGNYTEGYGMNHFGNMTGGYMMHNWNMTGGYGMNHFGNMTGGFGMHNPCMQFGGYGNYAMHRHHYGQFGNMTGGYMMHPYGNMTGGYMMHNWNMTGGYGMNHFGNMTGGFGMHNPCMQFGGYGNYAMHRHHYGQFGNMTGGYMMHPYGNMTGGYGMYSNGNVTNYMKVVPPTPSPEQQIKLGIPPNAVSCPSGYSLVINSFDSRPACISSSDITKFIARGWGHIS